MKAKSIFELTGKLGNICGQVRKSGQVIAPLSVPYSKSGKARSQAQIENMRLYSDTVFDWSKAAPADLTRWFNEAQEHDLSPFNMLVRIEIGSKYGEGEYGYSHYG